MYLGLSDHSGSRVHVLSLHATMAGKPRPTEGLGPCLSSVCLWDLMSCARRPWPFCRGHDPEPSPSEHGGRNIYLSTGFRKGQTGGAGCTVGVQDGSRAQWVLIEKCLRGPCSGDQDPSWMHRSGVEEADDTETGVGDMGSSPPTEPSPTSSAALAIWGRVSHGRNTGGAHPGRRKRPLLLLLGYEDVPGAVRWQRR